MDPLGNFSAILPTFRSFNVVVTPSFPQSIKITILAKNYGKIKDVNV
jgi:hypothetical protein